MLGSRFVAVIMILLSAVAMWNAWTVFVTGEPAGAGAFASVPVVNPGAESLWLGVNMALVFVVMLAMAVLNRTYILLHTTSILYAGLFMVMEAGSSLITASDMSGTVLCLTVMVGLYIMYSCYQMPGYTRSIFLVFLLLSAGCIWQWAFVVYIPVMILGCGQMRCLSMRSFLAAVIGVVTPVWILWGFGVISLQDFTLPQVRTVFAYLHSYDSCRPVAIMAVTVIAGFMATVSNLVKIYGSNARTRAFNGILTTITLVTQLMCVVDFGRLEAYMPLLNCCTAWQLAQYFRINGDKRAYFSIVLLLVIYACLYLWSVWG